MAVGQNPLLVSGGKKMELSPKTCVGQNPLLVSGGKKMEYVPKCVCERERERERERGREREIFYRLNVYISIIEHCQQFLPFFFFN